MYLDFSIKNAGFVFVVEVCDFSVLAYNFYSFNKYIVVELSFVVRNKKMLAKKCLLLLKLEINTVFSFPLWLFLSWKEI